MALAIEDINILELAYIKTTMTADDINQSLKRAAEYRFIKLKLGNTAYSIVEADPDFYRPLVDEFCTPVLAFGYKYLAFLQNMHEFEALVPDANSLNEKLEIKESLSSLVQQMVAAFENVGIKDPASNETSPKTPIH